MSKVITSLRKPVLAGMALMSLLVVTDLRSVLAGGSTDSTRDSEHRASITIGNFDFSPQTLVVTAGTRLVWINHDDAPHTVKGVDKGSPIASSPLDTGDEYTLVIAQPGTYKYFCTLHPMMVGTIVVQ
jgi:plastocyanin